MNVVGIDVINTAEEARWYLAAMIDGEGSIANTERGKYAHGYHRGAKIVNTDPDLIRACGRSCELLGITYSIITDEKKKSRKPHHSMCYILTIYGRDNLVKLLDVPLHSKKKRKNLEDSIATYRYIPVNDQLIKRLYEGGKSSSQIHIETGHSKSTVLRALHRSGAKIR